MYAPIMISSLVIKVELSEASVFLSKPSMVDYIYRQNALYYLRKQVSSECCKLPLPDLLMIQLISRVIGQQECDGALTHSRMRGNDPVHT